MLKQNQNWCKIKMHTYILLQVDIYHGDDDYMDNTALTSSHNAVLSNVFHPEEEK